MQQIHWQNGSLNLSNRSFTSRTSVVGKPYQEFPLDASVKSYVPSIWVDDMFAKFRGGSGYLGDDEIVVINAHSTLGGRNDAVCSALLRLREGAPFIRFNLIHPRVVRANYEPVTAFLGHADILSAEEAGDLGVRVSGGQCERMANMHAFGLLLDIAELAPATVVSGGHETVLTEEGEKRVEVYEPQRRMRFRRSR